MELFKIITLRELGFERPARSIAEVQRAINDHPNNQGKWVFDPVKKSIKVDGWYWATVFFEHGCYNYMYDSDIQIKVRLNNDDKLIRYKTWEGESIGSQHAISFPVRVEYDVIAIDTHHSVDEYISDAAILKKEDCSYLGVEIKGPYGSEIATNLRRTFGNDTTIQIQIDYFGDVVLSKKTSVVEMTLDINVENAIGHFTIVNLRTKDEEILDLLVLKGDKAWKSIESIMKKFNN